MEWIRASNWEDESGWLKRLGPDLSLDREILKAVIAKKPELVDQRTDARGLRQQFAASEAPGVRAAVDCGVEFSLPVAAVR